MAEHKIDIEKSAKNILDRVQQKLGISAEQLLELTQAYQEGRCVVLPFPLHRMLLDTSDPHNLELLKDLDALWNRVSCTVEYFSAKRRGRLYQAGERGSRGYAEERTQRGE